MAAHKLVTHLWFDKEAEEAARFYCSVFKDSRLGDITNYPKAGHDVHKMKEGSVMLVQFELMGAPFMALNAGPLFKFNEAVSILIPCDTQEEIDYYWDKLSAGGDQSKSACGWLRDKFGLAWQVDPAPLKDMLAHEDKARAGRVMAKMMEMVKIDLAELQKVFDAK